jgi:hypothetical protein
LPHVLYQSGFCVGTPTWTCLHAGGMVHDSKTLMLATFMFVFLLRGPTQGDPCDDVSPSRYVLPWGCGLRGLGAASKCSISLRDPGRNTYRACEVQTFESVVVSVECSRLRIPYQPLIAIFCTTDCATARKTGLSLDLGTQSRHAFMLCETAELPFAQTYMGAAVGKQ